MCGSGQIEGRHKHRKQAGMDIVLLKPQVGGNVVPSNSADVINKNVGKVQIIMHQA
jgi:hypothetical protein